jgi:hypothetical protein
VGDVLGARAPPRLQSDGADGAAADGRGGGGGGGSGGAALGDGAALGATLTWGGVQFEVGRASARAAVRGGVGAPRKRAAEACAVGRRSQSWRLEEGVSSSARSDCSRVKSSSSHHVHITTHTSVLCHRCRQPPRESKEQPPRASHRGAGALGALVPVRG